MSISANRRRRSWRSWSSGWRGRRPLPDAPALVAAILADPDPATALLRQLEALDAAHDGATQAAVFESLLWRLDKLDCWVWFRMARVYAALGRSDMCFVCAGRAVQVHPDWEATGQTYRDLFRHFRARGDDATAAAVAQRQRALVPSDPVGPAADVEAILRAAGIDPAQPVREEPVREEGAAVFDELAAVLRATFHAPGLAITPQTAAADVPGWDSLKHATVLLEIERAFGVVLEPHEALALERVGDLAALVARKTGRTKPGRGKKPGRPKLIVYGNCQGGAVSVVLRETPTIAARFDVVSHDVWAKGDELARNVADFETAEVFLQQDVRNWRDHPLCHSLPSGLRVARFPFCYVGALWPFDAMIAGADEPMLRAMRAAQEAGQEFPFGFQDGLLARLRHSVPDPGERLRRYRDLDIGSVPDIARMAELDEARLLADDARLGCTIGGYIAAHYRRVRLFHAIAHPTAALIGRLAAELVQRVGIDPGPGGLASYSDYMGNYQVPVHPAVIRALGLQWVDGSTRYNFHQREQLSFDEYYRRYVAVPVGA